MQLGVGGERRRARVRQKIREEARQARRLLPRGLRELDFRVERARLFGGELSDGRQFFTLPGQAGHGQLGLEAGGSIRRLAVLVE